MAFFLAHNCLIAILTVLNIISIATLSLKVTNYNFMHKDTGFDLNPNSNQNNQFIFSLPYHLYNSAPNLVITSSIISILAVLAILAFTLCAWPNGKKVRSNLSPCPTSPSS